MDVHGLSSVRIMSRIGDYTNLDSCVEAKIRDFVGVLFLLDSCPELSSVRIMSRGGHFGDYTRDTVYITLMSWTLDCPV